MAKSVRCSHENLMRNELPTLIIIKSERVIRFQSRISIFIAFHENLVGNEKANALRRRSSRSSGGLRVALDERMSIFARLDACTSIREFEKRRQRAHGLNPK